MAYFTFPIMSSLFKYCEFRFCWSVNLEIATKVLSFVHLEIATKVLSFVLQQVGVLFLFRVRSNSSSLLRNVAMISFISITRLGGPYIPSTHSSAYCTYLSLMPFAILMGLLFFVFAIGCFLLLFSHFYFRFS